MENTAHPLTLKRKAFLQARSFGLQNESRFFIQNLSILVSAGMNIETALASVYEELHPGRMRSVVKEILQDVDEGMSFSKALEKAGVVNSYTLALVTIGETSGQLSKNLMIAAAQNEKEAQFRSRIRSALAYSSFVLIIALVVGIGTAWYVLPQIATFFTAFNVPLPLSTRIIISTGSFLQRFGYIFIPAFVLVFLSLFYFLFSFPKTRFIGHTVLFHLPLFKELIRSTEISRFGFIVGTMIQAGTPLPIIFDILPTTTTFKNYASLFEYMGDRIDEGYSFQKLFAEYKNLSSVLPSAVRQMVVAAEKSGTLSDTFIKVGTLYEGKVDAASRNIPAFLEPALILVIGCIVAFLCLGILLPIYQIGLHF